MRVTTKECRIESKIGTFATTFEDIDVIFSSASKTGRMPPVACGESSEDITCRRVSVYDGPSFGQNPDDTGSIPSSRGCGSRPTTRISRTARWCAASAGRPPSTSRPSTERTTATRLRLVSPAGGLTSLLLVNAKEVMPDVFQASPTIGIDVLACVAPWGTIPVRLTKLAGDSWLQDLVGAPLTGDDAGKLRQLIGRAASHPGHPCRRARQPLRRCRRDARARLDGRRGACRDAPGPGALSWPLPSTSSTRAPIGPAPPCAS
jgi:hypothetical protein